MVAMSLTSTINAIAAYPYNILVNPRDFLLHVSREDSKVTSVSYFHQDAEYNKKKMIFLNNVGH